jgi:PhnB protein
MSSSVKAIPDGLRGAIPYLRIKGAADALVFYQHAFGAVETMRLIMPDGSIGHAEMKIGDAVVMLSDEFPQMGIVGPATLGNTSVGVAIYVEDVDAAFARAVAAGAVIAHPLANQFYGDRSGQLRDPFGHAWTLSTHIEDVSNEEMQKRLNAIYG